MTARLIQSALVTLIAIAFAIFVGVSVSRYISHAFDKAERALELVK